MKKRLKKNNEVELKHKLKHKRKMVPYSKFELFFNVVSLLFAIGVGLYFGVRSFYYYSMQSNKMAVDQFTLNGTITSNIKTVTEGDGLHQDTDGYYFKGNVENNYVKFANRLFRIIRINNDGSVKMISQDLATEFMWGEDSNYVESNLDKWLEKKEGLCGSGVYYDTLPYISDFLVKTNYNVPVFDGKSVNAGEDELNSYVTTLSIKDFSTANGKNSYLNIEKNYWLIGLDNDGSNLYVSEDGEILGASTYESYGIRPVITLKADTQISGGIGTENEPYTVNQGNKTNLVNTLINVDGYFWKVFAEDDESIKLIYTEPVGVYPNYAKNDAEFDPTEKNTLAYALNNNYYNAFNIKDKFLDFPIYTGEVSSDTSLDFYNYYASSNTVKIGIPNMFDYQVLDSDDYYLANTVSSGGSMIYVYHDYGSLGEAKVTETKKIYPVIRLSKSNVNLDGYEVH